MWPFDVKLLSMQVKRSKLRWDVARWLQTFPAIGFPAWSEVEHKGIIIEFEAA